MDLVAIAMVLSAAVLHALWNAFAKRSDDVLAYFFAIVTAALVFYAVPFAILASNEPFEWDWLRFAIASGLIHTAYFSLLAFAYERSDLSFAYPVARGTGLTLVPLLAVPIFGDQPTVAAWCGIALVVAGIIWLHQPLIATAIERGNARGLVSLPALLTGVTIAVYSINDTAGVRRANPIVYLYVVWVINFVLFAPYVLSKRTSGRSPGAEDIDAAIGRRHWIVRDVHDRPGRHAPRAGLLRRSDAGDQHRNWCNSRSADAERVARLDTG